MLIRYIRDSKKRPIGVVVALGRYELGYSLCNKKDKWDKKKGLMIAFNRAESGFKGHVPGSVLYDLEMMRLRALAYYKE